MCSYPNQLLVRRTMDLNYIKKKRATAMKWIIVNLLVLIVFLYDLSVHYTVGYVSFLVYVEVFISAVLTANTIHYAVCLLPSRQQPVPLSRYQQKLLGLADVDLDSSFVLSESSSKADVSVGADEAERASDAELSLSPRAWRSPPSPPSPSSPSPPSPLATSPQSSSSPPSPHSTHSPPSPTAATSSPRFSRSYDGLGSDYFIADRHSLSDYLRQYEERRRAESGAAASWLPAPAPPPPPYQLAATGPDNSKSEEGSPQGSPQVWWRLDLDPQRLTQWNLNLRLWIHVTILERLRAALDAAREELARAGQPAPGHVPPARLRAAPAPPGPPGPGPGPAVAALLPFLDLPAAADQRYYVRRIAELSRGGCLSDFRWSGGGADWEPSKPTDAEIVLHLFATYLDVQMPQTGNPRPFSSEHVSSAPAAPPRGPHALAIHRVTARPPHYVLALREDTIEVCRGRNNLMHTLLLLLASAAARRPPALGRLHLGPAGLNMLWILGR